MTKSPSSQFPSDPDATFLPVDMEGSPPPAGPSPESPASEAAPLDAEPLGLERALPPLRSGLEELGTEDVRIPQLKIRQAQTRSAEGVPDGSWFLTSEPERHAAQREAVLLSVRKERSLLLPYSGGDAAEAMIRRIEEQTLVEVPLDWEGPVCFSRDRVLPVAQEGIATLSPDCLGCPMSRWRTVRGRRVQDCAESYRILFFDLLAQLPCAFYARGSGIRPARDMLTALQVICRRLKSPAFAFKFKLSTRRIESADGTYFVPVFGRPEPVDDLSQIGFYGDMQRACAETPAEED